MTPIEAVECARKLSAERGWPWEGPVLVRVHWPVLFFGRREIFVRSNAKMPGGNVLVRFDAVSGELLRADFVPR